MSNQRDYQQPCRFYPGIMTLDRTRFARELTKERLPFLSSLTTVTSTVTESEPHEFLGKREPLREVFLKLDCHSQKAMIKTCHRWAWMFAFDPDNPRVKWEYEQSLNYVSDPNHEWKIITMRNGKRITENCGCIEYNNPDEKDMYHVEFRRYPQTGDRENNPIEVYSSSDEEEFEGEFSDSEDPMDLEINEESDS